MRPYNSASEVNLICVDWDKLATIENYIGAAINSNDAGRFIGENLVVNILIARLDQSPAKIHAIGHSLGAHLVGHIGRQVQAVGGVTIKRVTGNFKPYS